MRHIGVVETVAGVEQPAMWDMTGSGGSGDTGGRVLEGKWGGSGAAADETVFDVWPKGGEKEARKAERERLRARRKAIRLALEGLGAMLQKVAFDAAMFDQYKQENYLLGQRASEKKAEIRQAEDVLRGMLNEG